ncbi:uncharacterized protein LOC119168260 [Rhipicephalus microplus]|uniref:uncharacterized protein LOC119168260 n=1 Tax=Rhipicephalus microplus TaxID=6941 RepID=UPI003F6BA60C
MLVKRRVVSTSSAAGPSKRSATRTLKSSRHPACSQPMYFRCLNGSDYDRGEVIFVQRDAGSRQPGPGSCRPWHPDKVCARDSQAHFRKRRDCVQTCELRRDKRCLGLITEKFLRPCSRSAQDNPRRFWYYDRVRRVCVKWAPAITCAYNAFRSVGQCKMLCMVPHHDE